MEYGIKKCAMLVMKSGKRHLTDGIEFRKTVEYENDSDTNSNCALVTVTKRLIQGLEDFRIRRKTVQTTALLISARILGRVLET